MKKLIFDVDGTILDSMHIWIEPQNRLFSKYGFTLEDLTKEEKGFLESLDFIDWCEFVSKNIAKDMTKEQIQRYFDDILYDAYKNDLAPKNGAINKLSKLKSQGYSMSIASSTPFYYLELAFKRLDILDLFDFFATPDLLKTKKSDSKFWKYSINNHKSDSKNCILFDDALYALKAARTEGITTIGIKDFPYNESEWSFIKDVADYTLDTISDFNTQICNII